MTTAELAKAFSAVLLDWIGEEKLREVVRRNDAETDRGICHSHDFCDANQAMLDASGVDFDPDQIDDFNAAWDLARAERFYTEAAK